MKTKTKKKPPLIPPCIIDDTRKLYAVICTHMVDDKMEGVRLNGVYLWSITSDPVAAEASARDGSNTRKNGFPIMRIVELQKHQLQSIMLEALKKAKTREEEMQLAYQTMRTINKRRK